MWSPQLLAQIGRVLTAYSCPQGKLIGQLCRASPQSTRTQPLRCQEKTCWSQGHSVSVSTANLFCHYYLPRQASPSQPFPQSPQSPWLCGEVQIFSDLCPVPKYLRNVGGPPSECKYIIPASGKVSDPHTELQPLLRLTQYSYLSWASIVYNQLLHTESLYL